MGTMVMVIWALAIVDLVANNYLFFIFDRNLGGERIMMWFGWGMFMGPLFIVGFIILIYYLVNSSKSDQHSHHNRPYHDSESAFNILKERYAKGEITTEQFKEMQKELKS